MPRRRAAAAPEPVVEEDVFEDVDELEEELGEDDLEELEEPAPAPAKRGRPAKKATAPVAKAAPAESSEFDSNWLASYVTEETGVEYDSRAIRMLLRKLAKDGTLAREIGTDRSRYTFPKGANDPTVRQVVKLVKTGEAAAVKREGLDAVKASTAAKKAAAPAKKTAPAKAAPAKTATTRRRRTAAAE